MTHFYGIGTKVSHRICARFQIHDRCRIRHLTPTQLTSITAFLSSPTASQPPQRPQLANSDFVPSPLSTTPVLATKVTAKVAKKDPLQVLKIESDLRREVRENIAHQRMIGSYVGRRHAMGLPVRGQNTQTNAKTARRLNRIERW